MRSIKICIILWLTAVAGLAPNAIALTGPPSDPGMRVEKTVDLGVLPAPAGIQGRDGGYSIRFKDRSVWIFGDTLVGENTGRPCDLLLSNSWAWTADRDASDGIGPFVQPRDDDGRPRVLFAFTERERSYNARCFAEGDTQTGACNDRWALWPGAMVADPAGNRLIVFYEKVYVAAGVLNFIPVGHSVALWQDLEKPARRMPAMEDPEHPTLMFGHQAPGFGSGAVRVERMVYVFGCDRLGSRHPCRVARVPVDRVLDRNRWEVYTAGGRWCKDLRCGKPIFDGNGMISVFFNAYLDRFLAVYSRPMSTAVVMRSARKPQGPWSAPVKLFDARPPVNDIGWIYDALAHPEYSRGNGRQIFITYSRQTGPCSFERRLVSVRLGKNDGPTERGLTDTHRLPVPSLR